ncbi:MAG: hypothetical protein Q7J56_02985 [Deltaproteobacteria bacterium]|nr:hypothetical protein [Deltaproteobacteria bacterium]
MNTEPRTEPFTEHQQAIILNTWAQSGSECFVQRLPRSRGWIVEAQGYRIPKVFSTKRDAMNAADDWVVALSRRRHETRTA